MASFKVAAKNVEDACARAIGMQKGVNVALKANVVEQEEEEGALAASILCNSLLIPAPARHIN